MKLQKDLTRRAGMLVGVVGMAVGLAANVANAQQQQGRPMPAIVDEAQPQARFLGELFAPAPNLVPMVPNEVGCVTVRTITLAPSKLATASIGDRIDITPEPNLTETWIVSDVRRTLDGVVVRMTQEGNQTALATFVTVEDATAMTMQVASQKRRYRLHFAGNNQYHVWKMEAWQMPREEDADPDVVLPDPERQPGDDDWVPEGFGERNGGGCNNANPVIDVWLLYTVTARDSLGGTSATRAECALAVEHANTAYIQSSMTTRMRLVAATETTYTEAGTQDTDLDRLTGTSDGFIDGIHATRDTYNADLVHMVTDNGSGLGWCGGTSPGYNIGFSVSRWSRVAATFTLAHETGHNLGAEHDRANAGACISTSYSYGHLFFGTDGNGYCTVLAYPTATYDRVLHFSNPNVTFQGTATGIAIGQTGEAYNAQVIRNTDNTVEDHELTRYDIYVDFGFSGFPAEIGTTDFPYNTLPEGISAIDTPNTGSGESPTMYVDTGGTNYTGTISKVMTIVPCGGSVRIGPL